MKMKTIIVATLLIFMCGLSYSADLKIQSGTFIVLTPAEGMNEKLCELGEKKAKELGHNAICAFLNKQGHISFGKGSKVSFKDDQYTFDDGDMIINAGSKAIQLNKVVLNEGESAIAKNGMLKKQKEVLVLPKD